MTLIGNLMKWHTYRKALSVKRKWEDEADTHLREGTRQPQLREYISAVTIVGRYEEEKARKERENELLKEIERFALYR